MFFTINSFLEKERTMYMLCLLLIGQYLYPSFELTVLQDASLNSLIFEGAQYIKQHGEQFLSTAGSGLQAYEVQYVLQNPLNRVPSIRGTRGVRYFARELLAYFKGSLEVTPLAQAAPFWKTLADGNGCINSNYGYYVFYQKLPKDHNKTQLDWVIECFAKNKDTRKAFININGILHKDFQSKDFPCTIGLQFYIKKNNLYCVVSSRSTDVVTGLPYDMGFFAFVHELLYRLLQVRYPDQFADIQLGATVMKTSFTQIYDKTATIANTLSIDSIDVDQQMPLIDDPEQTLVDIYTGTQETDIMKWIHEHAN